MNPVSPLPRTAERIGSCSLQPRAPMTSARIREAGYLLLFFLTLSSAALQAQARQPDVPQPKLQASVDPIKHQATGIRQRFMTALRDCGIEPAFEPKIVVRTHPGMIAYFPGEQSVHLSRWTDLPPAVTGTLEAWAADGTLGLDAEQQFAEVFHSLLMPHELGHFLQHASGRLQTLDRWDSEVEANRIAIAFWSLDPAEVERLPARIENFVGFLERLPSPVPDGSEAREYFNTNYERLGDDGPAYGWYMGHFMRAAWAEREQSDFCTMARLNSPS